MPVGTSIPGGYSTTNVAAGATLQLQSPSGNSGGFNEASGKSLNLSGNGVNGDGALENVAGANSWTSTVTLNANSTIGVDDTSNLDISQAIGDDGFGYGITKVGTGTLQFTGDDTTNNTYTGLTDVTAGVLQLSKTLGGIAVAGNLEVGSPTAGSSTYLTQTQTITFNNFSSTGTEGYRLAFDGQETSLLTYHGDGISDAPAIESALNSLPFVHSNFGSPFTVTQTGPGVFSVTFSGLADEMNGTTWPEILGFRDSAMTTSSQSITVASADSNPVGTAALEQVQILAGSTNEIAPTATVTVSDGGELILNANAQQIIAQLNVNSGIVDLAAGSTLTLAGTGGSNASSGSLQRHGDH